jgi:indolepyruvate ferredoxin oxidoreductase
MRAIELNDVAVDDNKLAFTWGRLAAIDPDQIERALKTDSAVDETLAAAIARRRRFLVDYQNETLADRYEALIDKVRDAEAAISDTDQFSMAVAKSYFKLLSYKDEYEVARLHTRKEFIDSVRAEFGAKARFRFHLAPPMLNSGIDARGRPRKTEFGAWVIPVFRVLARLRGLRGTAFDLFGKTAERRMERALIVEFEQMIDEILPTLHDGRLEDATELVELYMNIRGYGPVKEESAGLVRRQVAERLQKRFAVAAEAA